MSALDPTSHTLASRLRRQAVLKRSTTQSEWFEKGLISACLVQIGILFSIDVSIMNAFIRLTLLLAIWIRCCCSASNLLILGWALFILSHVLSDGFLPADNAVFYSGRFPSTLTMSIYGDCALLILTAILASLRFDRPNLPNLTQDNAEPMAIFN
ncbi:hypothetical protein GEMRC1_006790 [Eukaryota sp. GEM-RC1]